jgi:hypothetical protein
MSTVVLISCVRRKLPTRARAKDLYISPLFKLNLKYALSLNPDNIFVLSAKYGLVSLGDEIEPYDLTLNKMKTDQVRSWADKVIEQLKTRVVLKTDHVIFLAGEKYRRYLLPEITSFKIPMEGLTIGRQLQFLKHATGDRLIV